MSTNPQLVPDISDERLQSLNINREDYTKQWREGVEREGHVPQPGQMAPDFEAERLSAEGKRTGEYFKLSSQRGRPIVLYFGSYT